jgi:hypothetical protein
MHAARESAAGFISVFLFLTHCSMQQLISATEE